VFPFIFFGRIIVMGNRLLQFAVLSLTFLVLNLVLFLTPSGKELIQDTFSRQGRVNPKTICEEYNPGQVSGVFNNKTCDVPDFIAEAKAQEQVLGNISGEKRIEIDLAQQRLYAYEGDKLVHNFVVSTGKWNRTPTGEFRIWIKLRATKMSGGSKALGTYYYLPNVPYTMYFYNAKYPMWMGYGIHGTYWHNNFGHPMSHGCINMKTPEAEILYYWAQPELRGGVSSIRAGTDNPGTRVLIYGQAPAY
jgi:lipoprotein-anchoring transpeptidase ErfK/SrfK